MRIRIAVWVLAVAAALPLAAGTISVDPNGDGSIDSVSLSWSLGNDPGPGGQSGVLIYSLPFLGTQGDLVLTFSDFPLIPLIVTRFNGDGTLAFYAANVGGPNLLADTPNPPGALYSNALEIDLLTAYDSSIATYTPGPGDPGYDASNPVYQIFSSVQDSSVPEPGTQWTALAALLVCARIPGLRKRFRRYEGGRG